MSVFGVFCGVLGEMRRERGNGLLTLENGDLDVGSGAFPSDGVVAGVQRLAFHVDFFIQLERALVGIAGDGGRREKQRRAEKNEREFREFHKKSFQNCRERAGQAQRAPSTEEFSFPWLLHWTLAGKLSYGAGHAKNGKE